MARSSRQDMTQAALQKLQQGKAATALRLAQKGLKAFRDDPDLLKILGLAATQSDQHKIAAKAYGDLLKQTPGAQDVMMSLGLALIQAGRADLARRRVDGWIAEAPTAVLWYLSALIASDQLDLSRTDQDATRALEIDPSLEGALATRGLARFDQGRFADALVDFQRADALNPALPETALNIGHCHQSLHQWAEAVAAFERCVALSPGDLEARSLLTRALEEAGHLDKAKDQYHLILAEDPAHWGSYMRLVELLKGAELSALEPAMRSHLPKVKTGSEDEAQATMALATLLDKTGRAKDAAPLFARSNAVEAKRRPYDPQEVDDLFAKMQRIFAQPLGGTPAPEETPRLIFVLGQPRSGTTLMEMVLSAHSDVVGLGELGFDEDLLNATLREDGFDVSRFQAGYLSGIPPHARAFDVFVDKMPAHYLYLGMLAEAFPTAKFVHMRRDPRDVAVSMWKRHLIGGLNAYGSDMRWMAHAANSYKRFMAHWETLYGNRITTVHYADLVSDTAGVARRLSAFCDLNWEPAMAHPEANKGQVRTASIVQVREKPHQRSIGTWETHATTLAPFIQGLDPDLWPELTL